MHFLSQLLCQVLSWNESRVTSVHLIMNIAPSKSFNPSELLATLEEEINYLYSLGILKKLYSKIFQLICFSIKKLFNQSKLNWKVWINKIENHVQERKKNHRSLTIFWKILVSKKMLLTHFYVNFLDINWKTKKST